MFDVVKNQTSDHLDIVATYGDIVALNGSDPKEDLYRSLDIQFNNTGGFGENDKLTFRADTDTVEYAGDIAPVPEAGTMSLLVAGLIGLAALRRKTRTKK